MHGSLFFAWLIIKQCFLSDESPLCTTDPGEKWLGYEGVGEDEELLASGKAAPTPVNRRRAARQGRESSSEQKQEAREGERAIESMVGGQATSFLGRKISQI